MWGSIIGGALSAASNIVGSSQQSSNIDEQIAANRQENAMNRQFNRQLQQDQNNWYYSMWSLNNAYNTPAAQRQRYEDAGLNPDLIYGQGTSGNSSAPAQGTAPGYSNPTDVSGIANKPTIGGIMSKTIQDALAMSQAEKNRAEAGSSRQDIITKQSFNKFADEINAANLDLTKAEARKVYKQYDEIVSQIDVNRQTSQMLISEAANLDQDTWKKRCDIILKSREVQAQIDYLERLGEKNTAEVLEILRQYTYGMATQADAAKMLSMQVDMLERILGKEGIFEIQENMIKFNWEMIQDYKELSLVIDMISGGLQAIGAIFTGLGNLKGRQTTFYQPGDRYTEIYPPAVR